MAEYEKRLKQREAELLVDQEHRLAALASSARRLSGAGPCGPGPDPPAGRSSDLGADGRHLLQLFRAVRRAGGGARHRPA